ncbi:MAG: DNA polymerase [Candidatus Heimdallarchaeota archaeon LC_3]|nr:MAG: DNA polymerase [Candidatus Heimdallarchaeota archaeon LC_3]
MSFSLSNHLQVKKSKEINSFSVIGFENWFQLIPKTIKEQDILLVDFKPHFYDEKDNSNKKNVLDEYGSESEDEYFNDDNEYDDEYQNSSQKSEKYKKQQISGITIFYLVETPLGFQKFRSFIQFNPYFYLLLEDGLDQDQITKVIWAVKDIGQHHIKNTSVKKLFDAKSLVFPKRKNFLCVETFVPNSVPFLREKLEKISNVIEWREADILYHRRVAIDLNLRIGRWYKAFFQNSKCTKLIINEKKVTTPPMNIVAYDIETNNPKNQQPDPNKHKISMISVFNLFTNVVLINSEVIDCSDINDFFVTTRKPEEDKNKPWIDYSPIIGKLDENKDIFKLKLINDLYKELKTNRKPPNENTDLILLKLKESKPVKKMDCLLRFIPQMLRNNPGLFEFLKKLHNFIDTQKNLEENTNILEFEPIQSIICPSETNMIELFIEILESEKPDIITDFNGNKFDVPFIQGRSENLNIKFKERIGFKLKPKIGLKEQDIKNWLRDIDGVESYGCFHLDAYLWTLKYSYLPKGMQGLKPAVENKLKIIPIGRDALWQLNNDEDSQTQGNSAEAVAYAGSDAYVTWLYTKNIILDFVISMGNIFPVTSNELLSVNAGTLDDLLIDAISHDNEIVTLKRYIQEGVGTLSSNLNVESITYTGGFVDSPNPGIWRKDIPYKIKIDKEFIKELKNELPELLTDIENKRLNKAKRSYFLENVQNLFTDQDQYFEFENKYLKENLEKLYRGAKESLINNIDQVNFVFEESRALKIIEKDKNRENLLQKIGLLEEPKEEYKGNVIHLDVTSMYPSQIRQYKIQPSGIVTKKFCEGCSEREPTENNEGVPICAFESPWTAKANLRKPCEHKIQTNPEKFPKGICRLKKENRIQLDNKSKNNIGCDYAPESESTCLYFSMGKLKDIKSYEFFKKSDNNALMAYKLNNSQFIEVPLESTYLSKGFKKGKNGNLSEQLLDRLTSWISKAIPGAEINYKGDNPFIIEEKSGNNIEWDGFLILDVSQKNSSFLISLKNRFCQKAYDHVAAIMDDFFQLRIHHKQEKTRLNRIIKEKIKRKESIPEEIASKVKFHDSMQLGLKVPLNSVYGLLGMKGGVHNASPPSAGVTTSLSVKLIRWAADYLGQLGPITEMDTDGIWIFIPEEVPTHYQIKIGKTVGNNNGKEFEYKDETVNLLEAILNNKVEKAFEHKNYWTNNHKNGIQKAKPRNLFKFEQDGPYSFQYVQGKKKYIVYNRNKEGKWDLKELIGLETKRRDFSKLHKEVQELIIQSFLENYENNTTLKKLYLNALKKVDQYVEDIKDGKFDDSYFVVPRSINNPLENYKAIGPDVATGFMLRDDFGYSIEPGSQVEFYHINPVKDKKTGTNLVVIPKIFFEVDIKEAKKFLKSHGIGYYTDIKTMDDIRKNLIKINYQKYIIELTGQGKIVSRMIEIVASRQNLINLNKPSSKNISEFFVTKKPKIIQKKSKEKIVNSMEGSKLEINNSTNPQLKMKKELKSEKEKILLSEIKIIIDNDKYNDIEEKSLLYSGSFLNYLEEMTQNYESHFTCPVCNLKFAQHQCLPGNICPYCQKKTNCSFY